MHSSFSQASVHRPRHPTIAAAIQREQQQKRMLQLQYQQQQQRHNNGQQYDPTVRAKLVEHNNRQQFQQSMAVSIPQPHQYQQKALGLQHQQQHQIHFNTQQQQQLLLPMQSPQHKPPQQQSRIPSSTTTPTQPITSQPTPNFNQISKTATNLLNDIYEKHLLNQTRFENANAINKQTAGGGGGFGAGHVGATEADFNLNGLTHQQHLQLQHQHHHQQQHQLRQQSVAGEQNKIPNVSYVPRLMGANGATLTAGTELMIKNNQRQRVPRKISESVALKIQKSLCEKQSAAAMMGVVGGGGMLAVRKQPPGGNEVNLFEPSYVHRTKTDVNLVYGGYEHSAAIQSKQYIQGLSGGSCDANGKISVRAEPVGGNNFYQDNLCEYSSIGGKAALATNGGAITTNNYEHRNSKINIMLETAQAMAAAAYFARFVEIYLLTTHMVVWLLWV